MIKSDQFLAKLTEEARLQAQIQARPVMPERLKSVAGLVATHTWQILLILSGLMAVVREVAL